MKHLLFIVGLLLLAGTAILRVYLIMPFPGSQNMNSVGFAYFLHKYGSWIQLLAIAMILYPAFFYLRQGSNWVRLFTITSMVMASAITFMALQMSAAKIFLQPEKVDFVAADQSTLGRDRLVVGLELNGEAKAYPMDYIAYHHQVRDSVGGVPIMVTYCSVCRTGRIYSPKVNGKLETFRLVGMDHFNAMFEDKTTGSWWRQENGEAVAGKMKGKTLDEIPSQQMTLKEWIALYPKSKLMLPDEKFTERYDNMASYDYGTRKNKLTGTDSLSWHDKSLVLGIAEDGKSVAINWNRLKQERVVNTQVGSMPVVCVLQDDDQSFHAWQREQDAKFAIDSTGLLKDNKTLSIWNMRGEAIEGPLTGAKLKPVHAYQEFWHSWRTFHPETEKY